MTRDPSNPIGRAFLERFNGHNLNGIEYKGEPCVLAFQQAEAMGADPHTFTNHVGALVRRGEMKEGKHVHFIQDPTMVDALRRAMGGGMDSMPAPVNESTTRIILLTRHGAIRAAMTSRAPKAKEFRDWAEEVLFTVMTTGGYGKQPRRFRPRLLTPREVATVNAVIRSAHEAENLGRPDDATELREWNLAVLAEEIREESSAQEPLFRVVPNAQAS